MILSQLYISICDVLRVIPPLLLSLLLTGCTTMPVFDDSHECWPGFIYGVDCEVKSE